MKGSAAVGPNNPTAINNNYLTVDQGRNPMLNEYANKDEQSRVGKGAVAPYFGRNDMDMENDMQ